jgi:hypothetical protein
MNRKEKKAISDKAYYKANKEKIKAYQEEINASEGIGVYKAVYPSGIYIGSGLIYRRKSHHLNGNTRIAKTLNEKAISFEVVSLCDTKEAAGLIEEKCISEYGLDNLLNTKKRG